MSSVRRVAWFTTVTTYLLVAIGGMVRATGSGLGCGDDWPRCNGRLIPLADYHTMVEFSHRLTASVLVVATIVLAVVARRFARGERAIVVPSSLAFPLVMSQAVIGAIVVKRDLEAESVVIHLTVAMTVLALLIAVTVRTLRRERGEPAIGTPVDPHFARTAVRVAVLVLAVLLVGSYVTGRGAGLVYRSWPWFNPLAPGTLHHLNALHRVLAGVTGGAVAWLAWRASKSAQPPLVQRLARSAFHLFLVQIAVGAANVWSELHPAVATAHLAVGAAIWALVFATAYVARQGGIPTGVRSATTVNASW